MSNSFDQLVARAPTVVDGLRARRAEIADAIHVHIREAVPDAVGERGSAYQAGALAAIGAVLDDGLKAIEHGSGWSEPIPADAAAQIRRAVRAGLGLGVVLRCYLAGHSRLSEFVEEEIERSGPADHAAVLHRIRRTLGALLESLTAAVEQEYERERQRIARSPEQRRLELVRRLLDAETVSRAELAGLGYRFDTWHVGVIATGGGARAALERLQTDSQLLMVSQDEDTVWAWLGAQRKLTHAEMERLRLDYEHAEVSLALGEPAQGLPGWRETHEQAQQVQQVVLRWRQTRARYADIALLTPWLEEPERARVLVDLYLSPLADQKDGGVVSREALRAYFEAGRVVAAAASQLGVDRRTLAYRLRTVEECLGYPLDARLAELWAALQLHDLLQKQECTNWKNPIHRTSTLA